MINCNKNFFVVSFSQQQVPPPTFHDERTLNSQYENGEDVQLQRQTARPKVFVLTIQVL